MVLQELSAGPAARCNGRGAKRSAAGPVRLTVGGGPVTVALMTSHTTAPNPATAGSPEARRRLRGATFGLVLGLLIQFLAGIWVNLFVTIPGAHPGSKPSEYFSGSFQSVVWAITGSGLPALVFHAAWGLILVLGGVSLAFQARRLHRRSVTVIAVLGFLFVLGAGFNGASFLDFNEDFSSMIMATLFALAMLCYVSILFILAGDGAPGHRDTGD